MLIPSTICNRKFHFSLKKFACNIALRMREIAWVYVIQNSTGKLYVGMTTELETRIAGHNSGVSKWTSDRGPWRLVWSQQCPSVGEARKLENKLKRQGRGSGFYRITGLPRSSGS